jgi:hypothetical protein
MTNEKTLKFVRSKAGAQARSAIDRYATEAGEAARKAPAETDVKIEGHFIAALPGGMCCRFVRQVHEAAADLAPGDWPFHSNTAAECEEKLKAEGREIGGPIPGCVICFTDGDVGHIVVYVGGSEVAENTSGERGEPRRPGTKITPISEVHAAHGGDHGRCYYAGKLVD